LSKTNSESPKSIIPKRSEVKLSDPTIASRKLYFVNEIVEWQLTLYLWTGCTKVHLRDMIMSHATELIRQIIRKQGLHTIYPGQEESAFGDLLQTAWVQIERTLYKYRACPHCRNCFNYDRPSDSLLYIPENREYGIITMDQVVKTCPKCDTALISTPFVEPIQGRYGGSETIIYRGMSKVFNMWSQIARTVILAYIKKEARDRKNSGSYMTHLNNKPKKVSDIMVRFLTEAREICRYNDDYQKILDALNWLIHNDDRPHDGIIGKLVQRSGLSRTTITSFMKHVKLRSLEFTDSPISRSRKDKPVERHRQDFDFDED